MKVLVTGANGFLGSWLTKRLLQEGHEVQALVRKNSDLSELDGAKPNFVYGDVTDYQSLQAHFKSQEIIFHLAGVIAYKKEARSLMEKVNVVGTENVVKACEQLQVPKLLHLSSVVAIGASFSPQVLNEKATYSISSLNLGYFETKKKAEDIVIKAALENRIRAVCVNPSTIYGYGDAKKGSRRNQVKVAQGKLRVYTPGGVNVVPVENVVDGILKAVEKGRNGERYILSSENLYIKDLFKKIAGFAGVSAPHVKMPSFALHGLGMLDDALSKVGLSVGISRENAYTASMFHWFDSTKAQQELGFDPGLADIAIENSVRWLKDQKVIK